jgi:ComF family protein
VISPLVRSFIDPLLDFVYPPVCYVCRRDVLNGEKVCAECWQHLPAINATHPSWIETREKLLADGIVKDFLTCYLFEKEGTLQEIVHLLKYGGVKSVGVMLGRELGKRMQIHEHFRSVSGLLPIPLHSAKERERGYNQCYHICQGISDVTGIPIDPSLIARVRHTESQTHLTIQQRRENVDGAFDVRKKHRGAIVGKTFILVDDVITTGATVTACARVLAQHGAMKILAASAAIAR